jgi:Flp pilus assembly protein TadB
VNRRAASPWHFSKTFSLDTIVQAVTILAFVAAPVFAWTRTMERSQEQTRIKQEAMEKKFNEQMAEDRERRNQFMAQFKELNDQMRAMQLSMATLVATQSVQAQLQNGRQRNER